MALTLIEIHDVALTVTTDGEVRARSPGAAVLDDGRVVTGQAAVDHLERRPRAMFREFWQALDEAPLAGGDRRCRHHADLAWAHLRDTLAIAGAPRHAVLAVPGHYDDTQLALLLGVAAAAGITVDALVDGAVAALAGCAGPGTYRLVDLWQGQVLIAEVAVDAQHAERVEVLALHGTGLLDVERQATELAAAALLRDARFDALHDAGSAAELRAQVPAWLARAAAGQAVDIGVTNGARRHTTRLPAAAFAALGATLARTLAPPLRGAQTVVLGAHLAALPGVLAGLAPAAVLPAGAAWRGVSAHAHVLEARPPAGAGLYTAWPVAANSTLAALPARPAPRDLRPTHVLAGGAAHRLDVDDVYLCADGNVARAAHADACATLVNVEDGVTLTPLTGDVLHNGRALRAACVVVAGDHITCGPGRVPFTPIVVDA